MSENKKRYQNKKEVDKSGNLLFFCASFHCSQAFLSIVEVLVPWFLHFTVQKLFFPLLKCWLERKLSTLMPGTKSPGTKSLDWLDRYTSKSQFTSVLRGVNPAYIFTGFMSGGPCNITSLPNCPGPEHTSYVFVLLYYCICAAFVLLYLCYCAIVLNMYVYYNM